MNNELIMKNLEEFVADNWVDTPYNHRGLPAKNLSLPQQPLLADGTLDYVIFDVIIESAVTITVPSECIRHSGFLQADIYVKEDTGRRQAMKYIDSLKSLFSYTRISGTLRMYEYLNSGSFEDRNGWVIYVCQWPFETEDYNP